MSVNATTNIPFSGCLSYGLSVDQLLNVLLGSPDKHCAHSCPMIDSVLNAPSKDLKRTDFCLFCMQ